MEVEATVGIAAVQLIGGAVVIINKGRAYSFTDDDKPAAADLGARLPVQMCTGLKLKLMTLRGKRLSEPRLNLPEYYEMRNHPRCGRTRGHRNLPILIWRDTQWKQQRKLHLARG